MSYLSFKIDYYAEYNRSSTRYSWLEILLWMESSSSKIIMLVLNRHGDTKTPKQCCCPESTNISLSTLFLFCDSCLFWHPPLFHLSSFTPLPTQKQYSISLQATGEWWISNESNLRRTLDSSRSSTLTRRSNLSRSYSSDWLPRQTSRRLHCRLCTSSQQRRRDACQEDTTALFRQHPPAEKHGDVFDAEIRWRPWWRHAPRVSDQVD